MKKIIFFYLCLLPSILMGQRIQPTNSSLILQDLEQLKFVGSVLYVAAHPDDENTRLIAYFANGRHAQTAYLSLTRGDGGQNLIGPEIREGLGVIRTQELLGARRVDGGSQFFSRANDFGYSKTAEETLRIWDEEKVLHDAVKIFRMYKPDVVVTRFPPDERAGHGHHTTSAIVAQKAFDLAADPNAYPELTKKYGAWQARRIFINTGRWWNPNMTGDEPGVLTVDVGAYDNLLGETYTEVAAKSRSQHKSQGFGATGSRGNSPEFLELVKGDVPENDVFDGIDTSWGRIEGGKTIGAMIDDVIQNFDSRNPSSSLPALLTIRKEIAALDSYWVDKKLPIVDQLIASMLGLYIEVRSLDPEVVPGQEFEVAFEVIQQSDLSVSLESLKSEMGTLSPNMTLSAGKGFYSESQMRVPENAEISESYWLKEAHGMGMYSVSNEELIGLPENPYQLPWTVALTVEGQSLTFEVPTQYRWNDPVKGEQHKPLVIAPEVLVSVDETVYLFSDNTPKRVNVKVRAAKDGVSGEVMLDLPEGWKASPSSIPFELANAGDQKQVFFNVQPPSDQTVGKLRAVASTSNGEFSKSLQSIAYDHIPDQVMFPEAEARLVRVTLNKYGERVGYISGAGDAVPATLKEIGYQVYEITDEDFTPEFIQTMDAIVLGIRALNTRENISYQMPLLLDYVKNGGTLIIQYNTSHRLKTNDFAPYPMKLSRDRVSEENAAVRILAKDHPVLNSPNKITDDDFDGWVQERGLYFPNEWSDEYTPILSSHDTNEPDRNGGLLVAEYGEGYYIYTGYSWFRELPAGVPGAIRLFTNMVSLGNEESSEAYGRNKK